MFMTDRPVSDAELEFSAPSQDWLLELMANFANSGVSQSVVLFVGGAVISGELISGPEYLERMASISENSPINGPAGSDEIVKNVADGFRQFKKMYLKPADAGEDWEAPRPGFIHLKNARVYATNGTIPGQGGFLWRGRISSIDAWAPGGMA